MADSNEAKVFVDFIRDVAVMHSRHEAILEHKRAGLNVALNAMDDKEIEKARFEVIEAFSASIDAYIQMHKRLEALKTQVSPWAIVSVVILIGPEDAQGLTVVHLLNRVNLN